MSFIGDMQKAIDKLSGLGPLIDIVGGLLEDYGKAQLRDLKISVKAETPTLWTEDGSLKGIPSAQVGAFLLVVLKCAAKQLRMRHG